MSEHILHPSDVKRLERSRTDKVLAGVSGGLGRYFDLRPAVFRLGFVVLTILGGAGVLVYLTAVLVMPKEGEERSIAEDVLANRREHPGRLVALGLVAVAVFSLLARADTWPSAGAAWALLAIAGLIFLWTRRGRGARGLVIAMLTLLALLVVSAVVAVTTAFAVFNVSLGDGVGARTYVPAAAADVRPQYHLGVGRLQLDLTSVHSTRPVRVAARLGIGELRVIVPPAARVHVASHVKAGSIDALGRHADGTSVRVDTGSGSSIVVDAQVGAGHVVVVRGW